MSALDSICDNYIISFIILLLQRWNALDKTSWMRPLLPTISGKPTTVQIVNGFWRVKFPCNISFLLCVLFCFVLFYIWCNFKAQTPSINVYRYALNIEIDYNKNTHILFFLQNFECLHLKKTSFEMCKVFNIWMECFVGVVIFQNEIERPIYELCRWKVLKKKLAPSAYEKRNWNVWLYNNKII